MTDKVKLIKTIYIYLVSFVALMMLVISAADLINLTLKTFVFTKADNYDRYAEPIGCEVGMKNMDYIDDNTAPINNTSTKLTTEECTKREKANLEREKANRAADRDRDFARNISMIIVALPLFWLHWWVARKKLS